MAGEDVLVRMAQRRKNLSPELRRFLRVQADLHQADIARALGVSPAAVSRWESGDRRPQGEVGEAYLDLLDRLAREVLS
jgi:DNA-binding transcriptional regulator YiaG